MSDFDNTPTSTFEKIMRAIIDGTSYTEEPRSVMEALLLELNDKIKRLSAAMKPAGSKDFADLGIPSEETVGLMYNINDAFTTNQYFIDGAGTSCPAGTTVYGIVSVDDQTGEESYWWDTLSTLVDLSAYLTKTDAASTYLGKTDAASTYLGKTDAASTYLGKTDASSTYLSKTDAASTYLSKSDASSTYADFEDLSAMTSQEIEALWGNV